MELYGHRGIPSLSPYNYDGDYQMKKTLVIEKDPVFVLVESWLAYTQVQIILIIKLFSGTTLFFKNGV